MELIKGQTAPEVWLAAVEHVAGCANAEDFDVFLHIAEPTVLSAADALVYQDVDSFLISHGAFSIHTVAETIFPLDEYVRHGASGLFKTYPEKLRTIQKGRTDGNWGSYSYRILRQKDFTGKPLTRSLTWSKRLQSTESTARPSNSAKAGHTNMR